MGTQNLNLGGMRLIEVHSGDDLIYRESSFGPDTEVPLFIGKSLVQNSFRVQPYFFDYHFRKQNQLPFLLTYLPNNMLML